MKKLNIIVVVLIVIGVCFGVSSFLINIVNDEKVQLSKQMLKTVADEVEEARKEIPVASSEKVSPENFATTDKIVAAANQLGVASDKLSFIITTPKEIMSYHSNQKMVAASTIKVAYCMSLIDAINNGLYSLDTQVKLKASDYEDGAGFVTEKYEDGAEWSMQELLQATLVYSDNTAFHAINRYVSFREVMSHSNASFPQEYVYGNYITAEIANSIMDKLSKEPEYELLRQYLSQATFSYGALEKVGGYAKYGFYENQCGLLLVSADGLRVTLYVSDLDEDSMSKLVAQILDIIKT